MKIPACSSFRTKFGFLLLLIVIPIEIFAQNSHQSKTKFGLAAGVNFTNTPTASYPEVSLSNTNSRYDIGFNFKAYLNLPIAKNILFQPELGFAFYQQKQIYAKGEVPNSLNSISVNDRSKETGVTLNAIFKYKTKFFQICAGPQLEWITYAAIKNHIVGVDYSGNLFEANQTIDFKSENKLKNPLFAFLFGLDRDLSKNWSVSLFYRLGVTDYTEENVHAKITKVSGFHIQVAYTFGH